MVIATQDLYLSGIRPKIIFASYNHSQKTSPEDILVHIVPAEALQHSAGLQAIYKKLAQLNIKRVPSTNLERIKLNRGSSAVYAVTRRLSRETTDLCCGIEIEAKNLLNYIRSVRVERIIIYNAEWLDSYTIRVLASVSRLLRNCAVFFVLVFSHNPMAASAIYDEAVAAYQRVWSGFCNIADPQVVFDIALPPLPITKLEDIDDIENWEQCLANISQSIEYLAYDRALYIIDKAKDLSISNDQLAQLHLLRATIHSNLGNQNLSQEILQKGLSLANDPILISRLNYCLGLILAKRRADLNGASQNFEIGKQTIIEADLTKTPQGLLELSWQDNGLALLDTMRARNSNEQDRFNFLSKAMQREMMALERLGNQHTEDADYLRFNLLANCTFLLEMQGKFHEAIELFQRVFGILDRQNGVNRTRFRMNYNYRMGVLALKAGDIQSAIASLQNSLCIAIEIEDAHLETRIRLAMAQVLLMDGRIKEARTEINKGLHITTQRSDRDMVKPFTILMEHLESNSKVTKPILPISPKLPAYIPLIDLLESPANDLNKLFSNPTEQLVLAEAR